MFMTPAMAFELAAFAAFVVLVVLVPYVRRKREYWTSRGVPVPHDRRSMASALPGVRLSDRSLAAYRHGAGAAPVLGLHDAGRPCALACDVRVATAALGNHGFAEPDARRNAATLVPVVVNTDAVAAVLPSMAQCVAELSTSLEAVANRRLSILPWAEVKKCAATVVATCVYGQPMIDSKIKAFVERCDEALSRSASAAADDAGLSEYFATFDMRSNDRPAPSTNTNFMQLLCTAAEDSDKIGSDVADKQVRLDMFEFVTGTIEPTAAFVTAALYELARNQNIQNRLREHLDCELDEHQTHFKIDQLDRLSYLENVLKETLRKYPLKTVVRRVTTKPYAVPDGGSNVKLEPGTLTVVPAHAYHHDAGYFAAPEAFQPNRFPEQLSSAYMPFGSGPQSYIGKHFVGLEAKLIVAMLVSRYEVHIDSSNPGRSPDPFDKTSFANVRMKVVNRSSRRVTELSTSLQQLNNNETSDKKFLFF